MRHDNQWLLDNNPFHAESGVNCADDFDEFARDYHEHMSNQNAQRMDRLGATNATLLKELSSKDERIAELEAEVERQHKAFYQQKLEAGEQCGIKVHTYAPHPLLAKEGK